MKTLLTSTLWYPWRSFERSLTQKKQNNEEVFVVLGFPRSGTSLVARLVSAAGISFGNPNRFRPADWRNPEGFFEYRDMNYIDRSLMKQAGNVSQHAFFNEGGIRARNTWYRLMRFFTRIRMVRVLRDIRSTGARWAFKEFPASFYFWSPYVPHARLIGVYRHPIEVAFSESRSFGRRSFLQYLEEWTRAHEELLYHLGTRPSILISLSDMARAETRTPVLRKLAVFVEGDASALEKTFSGKERFEKTKDALETFKQTYPLPARTQEVLAALDHMKLS